MNISALTTLTNEFASKLIENECSFEELIITASLIKQYLKASVSDHVEATFDEDHPLNLIVDQYGIGEYEEAEKDLLEFQALFN
jgi:hypothetical protein